VLEENNHLSVAALSAVHATRPLSRDV
jgi:hypothetical protein